MSKLDGIIAEFQEAQGEERLEILLEFAESLPPLPEEYIPQKEAGLNRIHECQSPVFMWIIVSSEKKVKIYADVPMEAPTVRGFVSILVEAFHESSQEEVLACPNDLIHKLGLVSLLGMMRLSGLTSIIRRLKQSVIEKS